MLPVADCVYHIDFQYAISYRYLRWNVLCKLNPLFLIYCLQAMPSQQVISISQCAQAVQRLVQEAGWTLREAVEMSAEALHKYRKRLQVNQAFIPNHTQVT